MNPVYEKILKCYESFQKKIDFKPEIALVLGSGLGDYAESIDVVMKGIQWQTLFFQHV